MSLRDVIRRIVLQEIRELVVEAVQVSTTDPRPDIIPARKRSVLYKGDSWAKKSVRLRVWEAVLLSLGRQRFQAGPHLFLASREGGDASVLRALGAPDRSMIAVDWDEEAISEFKKIYPGIRTASDDVANVLVSEDSFASVHLDLTSQITESYLARIILASKKIMPGGVIACAFTVGREKSFQKSINGCAYDARLGTVLDSIRSSIGYKPRVLLQFKYRSDSIHGIGTNMCVLVVQMVPFIEPAPKLQSISVYDFYRDIERHVNSRSLNLFINCSQSKTEELRARVMMYPPPRA